MSSLSVCIPTITMVQLSLASITAAGGKPAGVPKTKAKKASTARQLEVQKKHEARLSKAEGSDADGDKTMLEAVAITCIKEEKPQKGEAMRDKVIADRACTGTKLKAKARDPNVDADGDAIMTNVAKVAETRAKQAADKCKAHPNKASTSAASVALPEKKKGQIQPDVINVNDTPDMTPRQW